MDLYTKQYKLCSAFYWKSHIEAVRARYSRDRDSIHVQSYRRRFQDESRASNWMKRLLIHSNETLVVFFLAPAELIVIR